MSSDWYGTINLYLISAFLNKEFIARLGKFVIRTHAK